MSVLKLAKIIKTKRKSAQKFQEERWRRGFGCVKCGSIRAWKHRRLKNGLQKYRCEDCRHVFSDQSTTMLRWNKRRIDRIAVINHLSASGMSIRALAVESELSKNSVENLKKLIRKTRGFLYASVPKPQLKGIVENDETIMAGRWFWGADGFGGQFNAMDTARSWKWYLIVQKRFSRQKSGSILKKAPQC